VTDSKRRATIAQLPGTYGFALFPREEGLTDREIGVRLGLNPGRRRTC
jgi:hypothetical protein